MKSGDGKRNREELKKRLLVLSNLLIICVLLIQFPVSCVDGEYVDSDDANSAGMGAYFNSKVPDDVLSGFSDGFIVQFAPQMEMTKQYLTEDMKLDVKAEFKAIKAVKVNLDLEQLKELSTNDAVIWISPDRLVKASRIDPSHVQETTGTEQVLSASYSFWGLKFSGTTGNGVSVAVIDSGIAYDHADFTNITASMDYTLDNPIREGVPRSGTWGYDDYGHGTHVAGLISGSGYHSFQYGYDQYFTGQAPKAKLINLRVLEGDGAGYVSDVLSAIDYAIEHKEQYNIRVINLSLGVPPMSSHTTDPLAVACAAAVQDGMVVVAAAGNYGTYDGQPVYGGITSPAYSPYVIAVGAADTGDTDIRSDDFVADFSSKGPTLFDGLPKPDLIAPGTEVISSIAIRGALHENYPQAAIDPCDAGVYCRWWTPPTEYQRLSGTSMAAPIVAGTAALILQENQSLTPNAVKAILMGTAQTLPDEPYIHQGAGLLNTEGAVRLAGKIRDLSELEMGDVWTFEDVELESEIADEQVVWSQGVGWTGSLVSGIDVIFVYQPVYAFDVAWGQGVGWTGSITIGFDPVFNDPVTPVWNDNLLNPMSLPMSGEEILVGMDMNWEGEIEFIDSDNPAFPQSN